MKLSVATKERNRISMMEKRIHNIKNIGNLKSCTDWQLSNMLILISGVALTEVDCGEFLAEMGLACATSRNKILREQRSRR